jgi:formate C-acetyltransferase
MLINRFPKYGNDAMRWTSSPGEGVSHCREVEKYTNPRGGSFQPGLYPVSANVPLGAVVGATPDGRQAGTPLADGVSPVSGRDNAGPTAAVSSVAKLDHVIASNGTLLNQKFHPSVEGCCRPEEPDGSHGGPLRGWRPARSTTWSAGKPC